MMDVIAIVTGMVLMFSASFCFLVAGFRLSLCMSMVGALLAIWGIMARKSIPCEVVPSETLLISINGITRSMVVHDRDIIIMGGGDDGMSEYRVVRRPERWSLGLLCSEGPTVCERIDIDGRN